MMHASAGRKAQGNSSNGIDDGRLTVEKDIEGFCDNLPLHPFPSKKKLTTRQEVIKENS